MTYGFVYLWRDRKRNKFCVGSHYGQPDDGYITTTGHMMEVYRRRPNDFKRKILWWLLTPDLKRLQQEEQRWLDMIKDNELGRRYYNYKKHAAGGNGKANLGKKHLPEFAQKRWAARRKNGTDKGWKKSPEDAMKTANTRKANGSYVRTPEWTANWRKSYFKGKHSENTL